MFDGRIELDERCFGGVCKEKHGREAAGKVIGLWYSQALWRGLHNQNQA